jgi:hypothetical protein
MHLPDCLGKILERGRRIPIGVVCIALMFVLLSQCRSADQRTDAGTVATIPNTGGEAAPPVGEAAPNREVSGGAVPDRGPVGEAAPGGGPRRDAARLTRGRVAEALPPTADVPAADFVRVRVHYATDRNYVPNARPTAMYGAARGMLTFGY